MTATFEIEGEEGNVRPWMVRAGMLVVETSFEHDGGDGHLHVVLRRVSAEPRPIEHWTNVGASDD